MEGKSLTEAVDEFLRQLHIVRYASPNTLRAYARDLEDFLGFLGMEGISDWQQVTVITLRRFLNNLFAQGYERRTIARKLSAVRALFRFLAQQAHCCQPCRRIAPTSLAPKTADGVGRNASGRFAFSPRPQNTAWSSGSGIVGVALRGGIAGLRVGEFDRAGCGLRRRIGAG